MSANDMEIFALVTLWQRMNAMLSISKGNEGIDIKEGSQFNIVEDNYCTGQKDPLSACEIFTSRYCSAVH